MNNGVACVGVRVLCFDDEAKKLMAGDGRTGVAGPGGGMSLRVWHLNSTCSLDATW